MEAVPRMPMLAFELKACTEPVEFTPELKSHIASHYHENPESYNKECQEIEQLRQTAIRVSRDFVGCSTLKKYYAQLQFLQSRFPLSGRNDLAIAFTWEDVYSSRPISVADIRFEQLCILYNIGALHSILGALDNRSTPDGMKVSCTHFQCAAWAFQNLKDCFPTSWSPDTNPDLLSFHVNLMLAQAQECILEKSMTDNRKSSITAKVAAQIQEYYRQALRNLEACNPSAIVGSRKYKDWKRRIDLKLLYQECVMYLYLGNQSDEQQKWGERLAYYQASLAKLTEATKLAKSEGDSDIDEALRFTMDVVGGKHTNAKKENDFIYHESVPALDSLPEVKGASLVKGIPFNPNDTEISGPDIFQKLVSMEAHQASSVYSEEKAKLLREVGGRIEESDQELDQFLASLQLDPSKIRPETERLPQALLEKCAALSVKPDAVKDLVAAMQSVSNIATDVEGNIKEIEDLLAEETRRENEFQAAFGKRALNVTLDELEKNCSKYRDALSKASQQNTMLHRAMNTHTSNLKLLSSSLEELQKALPTHAALSPDDEAAVEQMKKLMDKVEEMKSQRRMLESQFREQVHKDDLTTSLAVREGDNQEAFFHEQLKKHDKMIGLLEQNMSAQGNILKALTEANAKYAVVRKAMSEVTVKREAMITGLMQSCDVYEDLLARSQQAVEFYNKMAPHVSSLLERTHRVCKVQEEERTQVQNRLKPKGPAPSRPSAPKPGQPGYQVPPTGATNSATGLPDDVAVASSAPTLKDFLPFMKPGTWSKSGKGTGGQNPVAPAAAEATGPSDVDPALLAMYPGLALLANEGQGQGGVPDAASAPSDIDPALLKMYPGLALIGQSQPSGGGSGGGGGQAAKTQEPSIDPALLKMYPGLALVSGGGGGSAGASSNRYGSLPGSLSQSPVHLPRQPSSQPSSPAMAARHAAYAPGAAYPGYNMNQPQTGSGQGQGPLMANTGSGHVLPESIQSPTAAPGAPSARRWPEQTPAAAGQNGTPPGGPGQGAQANASASHYQYPQQYPQAPSPAQASTQPSSVPASNPASVASTYPSQAQASAYPNTYYPTAAASGSYIGQPQTYASTAQPTANAASGYNQSTQAANTSVAAPASSSTSSQPQTTGYTATPQNQYPGAISQAYQTPSTTYQAAGAPQATASANTSVPTTQYPQANYGAQYSSASSQYPAVQSSASTASTGQTGTVYAGQTQQYYGQYTGQGQTAYQVPSTTTNQQAVTSTGTTPSVAGTQSGQYYGQYASQGQPVRGQGQMGYQVPSTGSQTNVAVSSSASTSMPSSQASSQNYTQYPAGYPVPSTASQAGGTSTASGQYYGQYPQVPSTAAQVSTAATSTPSQTSTQASGQYYGQYPHRSTGYQVPTTTSSHASVSATQPATGQYTNQYPGQATASASQPAMTTATSTQYYNQYQPQAGYQVPSTTSQASVASTSTTPSTQATTGQYSGQYQYPNQSQAGYPAVPISSTPATNQSQYPGSTTSTTASTSQTGQYQSQTGQYPAGQGQYSSTPQQGQYQYGQQYYQGYQQNYTAAAHSTPASTTTTTVSTASTAASQKFPVSTTQTAAYTGQQQYQGYQYSTEQYPSQAAGQSTTQRPQQLSTTSTTSPSYTSTSQGVYSQSGYATGTQGQTAQGQTVQGQGQYKGQTQYQGQQGYYTGQTQTGQGQTAYTGQGQAGYQSQGQTSYTQGQTSYAQGQANYTQGQTNYTQTQTSYTQGQTSYTQGQTPYPQGQTQAGYANQGYTQQQQPQGYQYPASQQGSVYQAQPPSSLPSPLKPTPAAGPGYPSPAISPAHSLSPAPTQDMPQESGRASSLPPENTQQPQDDSKLGRQKSVDDILSADTGKATTEDVLTPKVVTPEDIKRQKEEELKNSLKQVAKDPYIDPVVLEHFVADVEKFEKHVDGLCKQTLSGPSLLEKEWKELTEKQENFAKGSSMAIAKCYPMKNKSRDIMPYDNTRVVLEAGHDDYINASHIGDLSPSCPKFIATQNPLPATMADFWQMVYEQGTEVIVMLCQEVEGSQKNHRYLPEQKSEPVNHGHFTVTLQSVKSKGPWEERIVSLMHRDTRNSRSVVHLQFTQWSASGIPESPAHLLQFVLEVHSFYIQQRSLLRPVIVHCNNGVGRTGAFCTIYTGVQEINQGHSLVSVTDLVSQLRQKRKHMVQDRELLQFCYHAILYYAQDLLMKRGILTNRASFGDKLPPPGNKTSSHQRKPSDDFILGSGTSLSAIQSSVAKMHVRSPPEPQEVEGAVRQEGTESHVDGLENGVQQTQSLPTEATDGLIPMDNQPVQSQSTPAVAQMKSPEGSLSPANDRSRSGSASSVQSQGSANLVHTSPQHQAAQGVSMTNLPPSLADLQNPGTFKLEVTPPSKRKITKASFFNKDSSVQDSMSSDDPLSQLDPMWTIKPNQSAGPSS